MDHSLGGPRVNQDLRIFDEGLAPMVLHVTIKQDNLFWLAIADLVVEMQLLDKAQ